VEPGYHGGGGGGGGRGGGGSGGSSGKEYRFNAKEAGTYTNDRISNAIHFELIAKENIFLSVSDIRDILLKNIEKIVVVESSIEMISLELGNKTEKRKTDILMLVAKKQKVSIDTKKSKTFDEFVENLAKALFVKRNQIISMGKARSEIELVVMSKYPCIKKMVEANDVWKFDQANIVGGKELLEKLKKSFENDDSKDTFKNHIEVFLSENKPLWKKALNYLSTNRLTKWWNRGKIPEDANRLYYLSYVALYMFCIDITSGQSEEDLWKAILSKSNADLDFVQTQLKMALQEAETYGKAKQEYAKQAAENAKNAKTNFDKMLYEKERDEAAEAAVRAAHLFQSEDDLEESIAESARIVSDDSKGKGEADGSAYVPDEGKDSPPQEEDGDDSESGSEGKMMPVPTPVDGLPMFGDWRALRGDTFTKKLNERHTKINLEDLKLIHLRSAFSDIFLNPEVSGKIKTDTFYSIAKLLSVPGVDPTTKRTDLINKVESVWSALPTAAPTRADSEHHPFNALIHATLEPALGQYPTYYKTLHTKEDMSAAAPYSGNVEETYKTYHALLGVPLNMQPGVFINCHGSPQVHRKDKKKNRNYPTYRYDNNEAPLIDAPAMEMPALIPIARERSPVRGAGAVPKLIPIDKRVRRSRSRSRRSRSPKYEKMQAALPELVPIAPKYEEMESKLPELVPIQKALPKLVPMKKEFKTHMDFPDVDDIF
jgi:hypothetical protein